jgi:hypothetical protein
MRLKQTAYFAFLNCVLAWTSANAEISCPGQPQQASKDSAVAVEAAVGRLGPFKAADVKTNVNTTTADLIVKLPRADQVYLRQMLFAAFCTAIKDDPTVLNKSQLIQEYGRELIGNSPPPPPPPSRPSTTTDTVVAERICKVIYGSDPGNHKNFDTPMMKEESTEACIKYASSFRPEVTDVRLGCRRPPKATKFAQKWFALNSPHGIPHTDRYPFAPEPNCGWDDAFSK